jgi:hypothetical protein
MDILLARGSFTWSNNQDPSSISRLDRFLVSLNWEEHFLYLIHHSVFHPLSNHFLIMLDSRCMTRGTSYFKF